MFKPAPEYKTHTGLIVYNMSQESVCPTCGCHVRLEPQAIELPENLETCKGYFNKMMRQMAENYTRVQAINREAELKALQLKVYDDSFFPADMTTAKRMETLQVYIQLYLQQHPFMRISDIELIERKTDTGSRWYIQKKGK
jgi:hypothetical protein